MQSAVASLPRNVSFAPPRTSWLAYGRALTITVWLFSLVLNYWWRQDWDDLSEMASSGVNLKGYYYIGFFIAVLGHLTLGPTKWVNAVLALPSTTYGKFVTAFFFYALLVTPLSTNPLTSIKYLLATLCVLVLCSLFWATDIRVLRRTLVFTGFVLFAWLLLLLLHHGMPRGFSGTIGGINRNSIGKLAIAGMICLLFSEKKVLRLAAIAITTAFLVLVTSRGSLFAVAGFLAVYYALSKGTTRAMMHAFLGVFIVAFALMASSFLQKAVLQHVFRVNDERRGIGSGFSGRVENWERCLEVFKKRPLVGYGFRSTSGVGMPSAHSGYINLLLETGIIGAVLIVGAVIVAIIQRARFAQQLRPLAQQPGADPLYRDAYQLNIIAVSTLCAVAMLWTYEPLFINLGNVASIMFFLMLASPMWPTVARSPLATVSQRPRYAYAGQ